MSEGEIVKLIIVSLLLSAITSYGSGIEHRKSFIDDINGIAILGAIPGAMIGDIMVTGTEFNLFSNPKRGCSWICHLQDGWKNE